MTRWQPARWSREAPSYGDFHDRRRIPPVIYGPYFDPDPEDIESLGDPFKAAREVAELMADETGEPFAWGYYQVGGEARCAVCALEIATRYLIINGKTGL